MNIENYKNQIQDMTQEEINFEGRLLNYKNDAYYKLFQYIKSHIYLEFILKDHYLDKYEDLNNLTYGIANYGYLGLEKVDIINSIFDVPNSYHPNYTYTKKDLVILYKQLNGVHSYKLGIDFIIRTILAKFAMIRSIVFHDHNFDEQLPSNMSSYIINVLVGNPDKDGNFNYLDVIHNLLTQVQDAFDLLDDKTIFYGKNNQ